MIKPPELVVTHRNYGTLTQFSFEIDSRDFAQNYVVAILGDIGRRIAEKFVEERYDEIIKGISAEQIRDSITVEAVRVALKKWRDDD